MIFEQVTFVPSDIKHLRLFNSQHGSSHAEKQMNAWNNFFFQRHAVTAG